MLKTALNKLTSQTFASHSLTSESFTRKAANKLSMFYRKPLAIGLAINLGLAVAMQATPSMAASIQNQPNQNQSNSAKRVPQLNQATLVSNSNGQTIYALPIETNKQLTLPAVTPIQTGMVDGLAASVNDTPILKSQLDQAVRREKQYLRRQGKKPPADAQLRQRLLDALIVRQAQLSLVMRSGIRPADQLIEQQLLQFAQQNGLSSVAALQKEMDSRQPGSYATLRNRIIEDSSIVALQRSRIARQIDISEQDIDAFLASPAGKALNQSEYQTIHIRIPFLDDYSRLTQGQRDMAGQVAQKVIELLNQQDVSSNDEIAALLAQARGNYPVELQGGNMGFHTAKSLPTTLSNSITKLNKGEVSEPLQTPQGIDVIKLADKRDASQVMAPQWNTRHILIKVDEVQSNALAEQKINDIYEKLRQDGNFADLAATYSNDPGSASLGGDLGWVSVGQMVPEFDAMMQKTTKGDFSTPFRSQFGWHILQVTDTRQKDISQQILRGQARDRIYQRLAPQALEDWLQEVKASAYIKIYE